MVIYTSSGALRKEAHESTDSEVLFQISNEEYAIIKFEFNNWVFFDEGDYVTLFGNRYTLMDKPAPIEVNGSNRYAYTLKFQSPRAYTDKVIFQLFDPATLLVIPAYDAKTIYCKGSVVSKYTYNWVYIGVTPTLGNDTIEGAYWHKIPEWAAGSYVAGNHVYINNVVYLCLANTSIAPVEGAFWTVVNTAPAFDFNTILTPKGYAQLLCDNMNRARPNQHWIVGDCLSANPLSQAFSNTTCLGAMVDVCNLFQTEHWVDMDGDNFRININKLAYTTAPIISLSQGNGLTKITKKEISSSKRVTRLVALGSEKNIYGTYRNGSKRLMLPNRYYIDSANIDPSNPLEAVQTWDDVMPELHHATDDYNAATEYTAGSQVLDSTGKSFDCVLATTGHDTTNATYWGISQGTITGFVSQFIFEDSSLKFNPLDPQYIMADGTLPKAKFLTGNMGGYEFPIDNAVSLGTDLGYRITIQQISDATDSFLPLATFGFRQYDQYTLIDLYPPQSYVEDAELRLKAKAEAYLSQYSLDQNSYDCPVDIVWATTNLVGFKKGQIIHLVNANLGIDDDYRIITLKRNITLPYSQTIELSNLPYIPSSFTDLKNTVNQNNTYLQQGGVTSEMFKSRTFRGAKEALDMAFNPDGDYYTNKIAPLTVETTAILTGTRTQQFSVIGIKFTSVIATPNYISWISGSITDSVMEGAARTWTIGAGDFTATDGDKAVYYCYLKSPVDASVTGGEIIFTQTQYKTKGTTFYYFLVGTLGSMANGIREFHTSYGFSFIDGNNMTTGKVQSHDGLTYFDLDNNEIGGRIVFKDGLISGNISIKNDAGNERAWLNGASTPADDIILGIGGAKTDTNVPFKVYEDGSIHAANGKLKALADGSIDMEFRKPSTGGDVIITINSSTGVISTRKEGTAYTVSEMSTDGIIVNGGNIQALPGSSGIELKASIVGLGFGDVAVDYSGFAALCGVYGSALNSNATPAPAWGGYFNVLLANGFYGSVNNITNGNYATKRFLTKYDYIVNVYDTTDNRYVVLPATPQIGQHIIVKVINNVTVIIQGNGHPINRISDASELTLNIANDEKGRSVTLIFDGGRWNAHIFVL